MHRVETMLTILTQKNLHEKLHKYKYGVIVILHIDHANEKYGAKTHMKQFGVILECTKKFIGMEKFCPYISSHMSNGMFSFQPMYWYATHIYMDQNYEYEMKKQLRFGTKCIKESKGCSKAFYKQSKIVNKCMKTRARGSEDSSWVIWHIP